MNVRDLFKWWRKGSSEELSTLDYYSLTFTPGSMKALTPVARDGSKTADCTVGSGDDCTLIRAAT
jgi:hypothetical protein